MNTQMFCFAKDRDKVEALFKDYFWHYMSDVEGKEGLVFDKSCSLLEKEKAMNKIIMSEITSLPGLDFQVGGFDVSNEMMAQNPQFKWGAMAIVSSLIDIIMPDVLNKTLGLYTEMKYIGWGDSAKFDIESNDLFYVSKAGRNQRTVEKQTEYMGNVTVVPENRALTVQANLYKALCGQDSIAKFVRKAILSLEASIAKDAYTLWDTAMQNLPTTPVGGELNVTGWSEEDAIGIAQRVSAFNGSAKAMFVGTKLALRNVLPKDANYRYTLDSEYVKLGYIRNFVGYDVMELNQIANWEEPYKLGLNDNNIYVISPSVDKPLKLVYEGASRSNTVGFTESADLTEAVTINQSYGIGIATSSTSGIIQLA